MWSGNKSMDAIRQMSADYSEHELESLILRNPLDDDLRIQLENRLSATEPDSVELELLQRERKIAEALDAGEPVDDLIHAYQRFRVFRSDYFWDLRGSWGHLFRPFSLWLAFCDTTRAFALDVALQNKVKQRILFDSFPVEIVRDQMADSAFELKEGIIDFVPRYRGPSGKEPELTENEIVIVMRASYSTIPIVAHHAG